jgi:hypothetical protein
MVLLPRCGMRSAFGVRSTLTVLCGACPSALTVRALIN